LGVPSDGMRHKRYKRYTRHERHRHYRRPIGPNHAPPVPPVHDDYVGREITIHGRLRQHRRNLEAAPPCADAPNWEDTLSYGCNDYLLYGWCDDTRYDLTGPAGAQANCCGCRPSAPRTAVNSKGGFSAGGGGDGNTTWAGTAAVTATTAAVGIATGAGLLAGVVMTSVVPTMTVVGAAAAAGGGAGGVGAATGGMAGGGGMGVEAGAIGFLLEHIQGLALLHRLPTVQPCGMFATIARCVF
jgi:hypothetical protein